MSDRWGLRLVTGGPSTDQAAALFAEMLEGFSNFQTARGRNPNSIAKQLSTLTGLAGWARPGRGSGPPSSSTRGRRT